MSTSPKPSRAGYWLAAAIVIAATGWMMSASLEPADNAEPLPSRLTSTEPTSLATVAVATPESRMVNRTIDLSAHSEPNRTVMLKSEIRARVLKLHKRRGELVQAGDLLVTLDSRDWPDRVSQAKANLHQREIEQKSVLALRKRGLANESAEAQAATAVANANADLKNAELQLEATEIRAPFDGVLNDRLVEVGDFLQDGAAVAEILDLDPLVISAQLPEQHLRHAQTGMMASARFADGREAEGRIRYLSRAANEATRTFRIELEVPNPGQRELSSGTTAKLMIPLGEQLLHHVSPALLVLDDAGRMGLKAVNEQQQVIFLPVELAGADQSGAWLSGVPADARVITRGQGYVEPGETVTLARDEPETGSVVANGDQ